ncbi:MAG: PDGLE domain-containing protein [Rhodoferax sp.]|nr:PDGLE domain-containing protein [Rhodoferax sp.]
MHMADALISPTVGAALWLVSGVALVWSCRRVQQSPHEDLTALMGAMGAFVFAAQMVNFAIPGTGSSGHLAGSLLLSVVLGAPAALVVMASVLTVQALFFADGGLLALGANIFNLGLVPCLLAYPWVRRAWAHQTDGCALQPKVRRAVVVAALVSAQLGALGVVLQTVASGVLSLPFEGFLWSMLGIHLAIGSAEGLATAAILSFLVRARPDLFLRLHGQAVTPARTGRYKSLLVGLFASSLLLASGGAWLASNRPDGLAWSLQNVVTGSPNSVPVAAVQPALEQTRQLLALPPHPVAAAPQPSALSASSPTEPAPDARGAWAGVIGASVTLALVGGLVALLRRRRHHTP